MRDNDNNNNNYSKNIDNNNKNEMIKTVIKHWCERDMEHIRKIGWLVGVTAQMCQLI